MNPDRDASPSASLHDIAVDAQADIQKLATGLAHAGANPQAVQTLTRMLEVLSQVVKALASGPPVGQEQGGPPPGPPGPQAPPQPGAQPQQAAPPGNFHSATQQLHQAMQASAAQR